LPRSIVSGLAELHGTFALVTEPVADFGVLGSDTVVWESRRPYTYLRAVDHRWMIGGMDLRHEGDGHRDEVLPARTRALEDELTRLVPGSAAPTAFSWGGTFGSTDDGLPVIGEIAAMPGVYVAVGYGGNGITFSAVAATIIRDVCLGRPNGDARIFRPDR
jgi:glycine/D-amino acid oxidase-like deaminating enzyme